MEKTQGGFIFFVGLLMGLVIGWAIGYAANNPTIHGDLNNAA